MTKCDICNKEKPICPEDGMCSLCHYNPLQELRGNNSC